MISVSEIKKRADYYQLWTCITNIDATHFVVEAVNNSNCMLNEGLEDVRDDGAYMKMTVAIGPTIDGEEMISVTTLVTDMDRHETKVFHDTDIETAICVANHEMSIISSRFFEDIFDAVDDSYWYDKYNDEIESAWALHDAE